jgi:hypothetical protein
VKSDTETKSENEMVMSQLKKAFQTKKTNWISVKDSVARVRDSRVVYNR